MNLTIDPQAAGWEDDGTESGAIRVKSVRGDLVPVPFRSTYYQGDVGSGCSVSWQSQGIVTNEDGSMTGLLVSVAAGVNAGATVWQPFYGRVLGIRFSRNPSQAPADFGVLIDGVAYPVLGPPPGWEAVEAVSLNEAALMVAADNLADGWHMAQLAFPSGGGPRQWVLHGLLVEQRAGYRPPPRQLQLIGTAALTTTQTAIPNVYSNYPAVLGLRGILYTNISGSAATVTVKNGSAVMWQKSLAAGDSATLDFGERLAIDSGLTHAAGANSAINATPLGGV